MIGKKKICVNCGKEDFYWSNKRCKSCALKEDFKPIQVNKSINKVSEGMGRKLKIYSKLRKEFLAKHPLCQCGVVGCTKVVKDVHHRNGRTGNLLNDTRFWLAVCRECHDWIHKNFKEALELGFLLSRFGKK